MLNADNLTISVPVEAKHGGSNPLCNKNCGYCISHLYTSWDSRASKIF